MRRRALLALGPAALAGRVNAEKPLYPLRWVYVSRGLARDQDLMYTTWQNKYALLADFGDSVSTGR